MLLRIRARCVRRLRPHRKPPARFPIVCWRFVHSIMMIHRGAADGRAILLPFRLRSTCSTLWKRAFPHPRTDSQRFGLSSPSDYSLVLSQLSPVVNPWTKRWESFKLFRQITIEVALRDSRMQQSRILSEIRRTISRRSMGKQSPLLLSATEH